LAEKNCSSNSILLFEENKPSQRFPSDRLQQLFRAGGMAANLSQACLISNLVEMAFSPLLSYNKSFHWANSYVP
jgi:hypothetical protein